MKLRRSIAGSIFGGVAYQTTWRAKLGCRHFLRRAVSSAVGAGLDCFGCMRDPVGGCTRCCYSRWTMYVSEPTAPIGCLGRPRPRVAAAYTRHNVEELHTLSHGYVCSHTTSNPSRHDHFSIPTSFTGGKVFPAGNSKLPQYRVILRITCSGYDRESRFGPEVFSL
jgi:hypothetical protein